MLRAVVVLGLAIACSGSGGVQAYEDCADAPCRQQWLLQRWEQDPAEVISLVAALADPIEQEILVNALVEGNPGEAGALCESLTQPAVRDRCVKIDTRPHLRATTPEEVLKEAARETPGTFRELSTHFRDRSPWTSTEAPPAIECAVKPPTNACRSAAALALTRQAAYPQAAATCTSIPERQWRNECFFQAAEAAVQPGSSKTLRTSRLVPGVELCLGADTYVTQCLQHLLDWVARAAPPGDSADAAAWAKVNQSVDTVAERLSALDPALGAAARDRAWARIMVRSILPAATLTGDALDHTPPEAAPHLRAAAALRLVEASSLQVTLAEVQELLEQSLEARATEAPGYAGDLPGLAAIGTWSEVLPGEEALPWIHYLADLRRVVHDDPRTDGVICALEAAAQARPPRLGVITQGLAHEDPLVRWTAARLVAGADPGGRARLPASDPDPLVAARLKR